VKNIHVLGDAIQPASLMPKSGHMANQHAKVLRGPPSSRCWRARRRIRSPFSPTPGYSFITDKDVVHVCSVHQYDKDKKTGAAGARVRRPVACDERARGALRVELGEEHLGPTCSASASCVA
jgi:hypothetical protein